MLQILFELVLQRIPLILIKQIIGQTDFIEEQLKDFEIKNSTLIHQTNQVILPSQKLVMFLMIFHVLNQPLN